MYKAIICRIPFVKEHSNADRLNVTTLFNNQVIISTDTKVGEIGAYFPSDGQLSHQFCSNNNLYRHSKLNIDKEQTGYIEDSRRIRALTLRGEKSDGMWMPISCLDFVGKHKLKIGDQFDSVNGIEICKKHIVQQRISEGKKNRKTKRIRKFYPMFKEHVDTNQLAYNIGRLEEGSYLIITSKYHGTSQRTGNIKSIKALNWFQKAVNKVTGFWNNKWETVTGTRRVILHNFNDPKKLDHYGSNEFRKVHHDKFVGKLKKGETVYYEIVGWCNEAKPIMNSCSNKKVKDKAFVKQYGDMTVFKYGCPQGVSDIYVYRITMTNEEGFSIDYPWEAVKERCNELDVKYVHEYDKFIYDGNKEKLMKHVEELSEGPDPVDPSHIKEGIVVRIEKGMNFKAFKHKSFIFKVIEGIVKDEGEIDLEEQQEGETN